MTGLAKRWTGLAIVVASMVAMSIAGWSYASANTSGVTTQAVAALPGHDILGSWRVTATALEPVPSTAHVLITFTPGGGLVETRLLAKPPIPGVVDFATMETPGHGGWVKTGPRSYEIEYLYLIQAEGSADLLATETVRWEATISSDGEAISGPASSEVHLADGTLVVSWTFTASGTRIAP